MAQFHEISGAVTAPQGFTAAAVNCGVKADKPDLVLILSEKPATAATMVTRNIFRAAPTFVTQEHVGNGVAQAVVANSGCANSATGERGLADAHEMARMAAEALQIAPDDVVVCSTGHIGYFLPMDKIGSGVKLAAEQLSAEAGEEAARGIMTTDTAPKFVAVEFEVGGVTCRMGAIAKGAGMICPNMATMLCFITTDAAIEVGLLRLALSGAVEQSFNCISVDGDMSTNDTVAVLANGMAGNTKLATPGDPGFDNFRAALEFVTLTLAKKMAADGEGCTKSIVIQVTGARSWEQARTIGKAIANYNLFKTAVFGQDFNWGRVAAAIGGSLEPVDPAGMSIKMQGIEAWHGAVLDFDYAAARQAMQAKEILVEVDLGVGEAQATVWSCDLTPEYVLENAIYEVNL